MSNSNPKSSLSIINYITGISDGLLLPIIPCGLISLYLSHEMNKSYWLMLFSLYLATTCIGAIVYGFARYLGEKNEIKHNHPDFAKAEFIKDKKRLLQIGIDDRLATEMMHQTNKEQADWLKEIKENGMDWDIYDNHRAKRSGMQTGLGFIIGAFLILLPFLSFNLEKFTLLSFFCSEFILMYTFGWLKGKYLKKDPLRLAFVQVLMGFLIIVVLFVSIFIIDSL